MSSAAATTEVRFLRKGQPSDRPAVAEGERPKEKRGGPRIRCPRCAWEPRREDQWMCTCLHQWHTFDTEGVCPGCGRQWRETQCPRCKEWSPHRDWYVQED